MNQRVESFTKSLKRWLKILINNFLQLLFTYQIKRNIHVIAFKIKSSSEKVRRESRIPKCFCERFLTRVKEALTQNANCFIFNKFFEIKGDE